MRSHIRKTLAVFALTAFVAAVTVPADAAASTPVEVAQSAPVQAESGQGLLGCAACAFGAGIIAAGGIGAIITFLATPGSEALLVVCAMECGL